MLRLLEVGVLLKVKRPAGEGAAVWRRQGGVVMSINRDRAHSVGKTQELEAQRQEE